MEASQWAKVRLGDRGAGIGRAVKIAAPFETEARAPRACSGALYRSLPCQFSPLAVVKGIVAPTLPHLPGPPRLGSWQASAAAGHAAGHAALDAPSCSEVSHDAAAGEGYWHFRWPSPCLAPMPPDLSDQQACTSRPRHRGLARSERSERLCAALNAMWSGDSAPSFALRATPSSEREEAARGHKMADRVDHTSPVCLWK